MAALKTESQSLQGWTKRLYENLWDLNERPRDGRSSALKMLTTWVSPLRMQIMSTSSWLRPQIGNENNLLLLALENLDPGTHKIKWPWKVQVGPKWRVGHTTLVLPAPSKAILFYGYLDLNSQGQEAEDCFHYRPRVLPDYWCP